MSNFTFVLIAVILSVFGNVGCRDAGGGSPGQPSRGSVQYGLSDEKLSALKDAFLYPKSNGSLGVQNGIKKDIYGFDKHEYFEFGNDVKNGDDGYKPGTAIPGADGDNFDDDYTYHGSMVFDKNASHIAPDKYITHGSHTGIKQYPWLVHLKVKYQEGTETKAVGCGGSLVSWRHVITAAHCVHFNIKDNTDVSIFLAEYNIRTFPTDCVGSECIENIRMHPDRITRHSGFRLRPIRNDIALLRLNRPAPNNGYIRPIALPTFNFNVPRYNGKPLTITGWGRTEHGEVSAVKRHAQVKLVGPKNCKRHFPAVTNAMLCAFSRTGQDVGKGDSGGPLMARYGGKFHLVGICSSSSLINGVPSKYTNVYFYLNWIRKSM